MTKANEYTGLLLVTLCLASACEPDLVLDPLRSYNDTWAGTLTLDGGATLELNTGIHIVALDEQLSVEDNHARKTAFYDLTIAGKRYATIGFISHWDLREAPSEASAIPDREFASIQLGGYGLPLVDTEENRARVAEFNQRWKTLVVEFGGAEDSLFRSLDLHGEVVSDAIDGVVWLSETPRASDTIRNRRLGTFHLRRTGPTHPLAVDVNRIELEEFVFRTDGTRQSRSSRLFIK
jgi:hypothetical protein